MDEFMETAFAEAMHRKLIREFQYRLLIGLL